MPIGFLRQVFQAADSETAFLWRGQPFSYGWLLGALDRWKAQLQAESVLPGTVVVLQSDFCPEAVAAMLALIEQACIVVPITAAAGQQADEFIALAQAERVIPPFSGLEQHAVLTRTKVCADHPLYERLRREGHPGLVLFSSGSTGQSKGVVHDLVRLLKKYQLRRQNLRTLAFLLFDHIGGFDTLFYCLSNGSSLVLVEDRSPEAICAAVARYRVEVLPVAPTFLSLLVISGAYTLHDLSTLKYVTYGAEVMSEATLQACRRILPQAVLLQKYGTSEVGTLRSHSESSDSLWVKLGGEGYQVRVVDGLLQIKSESAMLGYLNAPSPFTEDGWFITGDIVEVNGDYFRILGRQSDLVNVGGQKVYPAEVENVIQQLDNVADVVVFGERNPITGQIVCAKVTLVQPEPLKDLTLRLKLFCLQKLAAYKVPVKVVLAEGPLWGARLKRQRRPVEPTPNLWL